MSTIQPNQHRSLAILNLPKPVGPLLTYARGIVTRMTGNALFTSPTPSLAVLTAAIGDVQTAETAALSRLKGAVSARNQKRAELVLLLDQIRVYVQSVADANLETGTTVIESAGLSVKKPAVRKPRVFAALTGAVSGSAKLVARSAGHRASYEWQYSTDGGKTWTLAPVTLQAKTTVPGFAPGASVAFRYRAVTKAGEGDWSQAVTLVIK